VLQCVLVLISWYDIQNVGRTRAQKGQPVIPEHAGTECKIVDIIAVVCSGKLTDKELDPGLLSEGVEQQH
jgi:hypothetical protein